MKPLNFNFTFAIVLIFVSGIPHSLRAEDGRHTFGVQSGQVGLLQDVGSTYGSALGYGAFFDYASSDWLELELSFLASKHSLGNLNLTQNSYNASVIYNIDELDSFTPSFKVGAEFVTHSQDIYSNNLTASPSVVSSNNTGFGLLIGAGGKFMLGSHFSAGLDITYHSLFDVLVTPPGNSSSQKVIQSYYTLLLKIGYVFGANK